MQSALTALSRVRPKIMSLGISNDKITSDSLSMDERVVVMRDGVQINNNDDDEEKEDEEGKKIKREKFVLYTATISIRIQLESETTTLFGKLMLEMLDRGICSHAAPDYATSKLTESYDIVMKVVAMLLLKMQVLKLSCY